MRTAIIAFSVLLAGCSPAPPSDPDVTAYFRKHEPLLNELVKLGIEHPVLRRIEPEMKRYADYNGVPTAEDVAAAARAYQILAAISADFVRYWREGEEPSGKLFCVEVPVYRWGLSLGGYSVMLVYSPDFVADPPKADPKRPYQRIADTSWFIEHSDTR